MLDKDIFKGTENDQFRMQPFHHYSKGMGVKFVKVDAGNSSSCTIMY